MDWSHVCKAILLVQTIAGFCSNLGIRGLFSSPFVSYWVHIDWLAPGCLIESGNPTISRETKTQVWAACQPWQPQILNALVQLLYSFSLGFLFLFFLMVALIVFCQTSHFVAHALVS